MVGFVKMEVGVRRGTLCEQKWEASLISLDSDAQERARDERAAHNMPTACNAEQSLPLPRTTGHIEMIVKCLQTAASKPKIFVHDLNILHFLSTASLSSASTSAVDDEHLLRLHTEIQATGRKFSVERATEIENLNMSADETVAKARVLSAQSAALLFYPCPNPTNAGVWEVRFLDQRNSNQADLRFERFMDWGEQEVLRYIDVAVKLGNADRLQPSRLALEDPQMFWQVCFRFAETFPRLSKIAKQDEWKDTMEEGLLTASKSGKTQYALPSFGRKMEKAVLDGGESVRMQLSAAGLEAGMVYVTEHTPDGAHLQVEQDGDVMALNPEAARSTAAMQRILAREASFQEEVRERGVGVGQRVVVGGLVQFNGRRGTVQALDEAAGRVLVALDGGGEKLSVPLDNARSEARQTQRESRKYSSCCVCVGCGKVESAPGVFKFCSGCKRVHYCGKECQHADWKLGHKKLCAPLPALLPTVPGLLQLVVLPGPGPGRPYPKLVRAQRPSAQRDALARFLAADSWADVRCLRVQRGGSEALGEGGALHRAVLLYNAAATAVAPDNGRAKALSTPSGTMLVAGEVRGDAVVVCAPPSLDLAQLCPPDGAPPPPDVPLLEDLAMEAYNKHLGHFVMTKLGGDGMVAEFFGHTPEGERKLRKFVSLFTPPAPPF